MRTSTPVVDSQRSAERLRVNPRRSHVKEGERKRVKTACNNCNQRRIRCSGETPSCSQCTTAQRDCAYPCVDKKVFVAEKELDSYKTDLSLLQRTLLLAVPDPVRRKSLLSQARQSMGPLAIRTPSIKEDEMHFSSSPAASVSTVAISPPHEHVLTQYQHAYQAEHQPRKFIGFMDAAATEGSLLQDRDGTKRWLGGTSGATFLDHLKKFMHTLKSSLGYNRTPRETSPGFNFLASRGQYQTSDSRLLFTPTAQDNANPFSPSDNWNTAGSRLAKVSELLQDGMGRWACGGIHYFGDFSLQSWGTVQETGNSMNNNNPPPRELAFYEAAFALGTVYSLTAANSRQDGQLGEMSFVKARKILGDLTDTRFGMADVPTLALLAMYMAEMNRRDSAYIFLSHALTICCMFGGLKGSFSDERDRRIVWTLFCLTKDASCLMGRPPLYPDEAFQLPYPTFVPGLPPPDGLVAHINLCKLAGYIVSNTYSIAPRENITRFQDPVAQVTEPLRMLECWREQLPPNLQIPLELPPELQIPLDDSPTDEGLPTDRALCMLHMRWNQLLILTLRPLFFLAVKSSVGGDFINAPRDMLEHPGINGDCILQCSAAARRNLRLGRHIYDRWSRDNTPVENGSLQPQQQPGKLVMLDLHHIFNATVVLLLHQMVFSNVINTDTIGIRAARAIFEGEARTECASPGSGGNGGAPPATGYASDCLAVLTDLSALVARIRPLRFRGSEHTTTGIDAVEWGPGLVDYHRPNIHNGAASSGGNQHDAGDGTGGYSVAGAFGCPSPALISEEELAANLSLQNPFGPDQTYGEMPPMLFSTVAQGDMDVGLEHGVGYTNQKELERWVQEGRQFSGLNMPLGGYMGM